MSLVFAYIVPVLLVLILFRFIQLKKSIKNRDYDYSYYEDGPYGPRVKEPTTLLGKIKKALGFKNYVLLIIAIGATQTGCEEKPPIGTSGSYEKGVFCINEGIFGQTSGTISHYDPITKKASQKIFNQVNSRDLGNVVQSLHFTTDRGYVIVNNSNKIEVVDPNTFEEVAQITGLEQPRYMVSKSNVGYVSQWGVDGLTGSIVVLNLVTNSIQQTIPVGKGPEELFWKNDQLYVPLVGGYGTDNKVIVINTLTNTIVDTIVVADKPSSCQVDSRGDIWVLCGGKTIYTTFPTIDINASTTSALIRLDNNNNIAYQKNFGKGKGASNLTYNNIADLFYYTREGKVWAFSPATQQEQDLLTGSFYGLSFDNNTNHLYTASNSGVNTAVAKSYTAGGVLVDSFAVGVFANGFVFR